MFAIYSDKRFDSRHNSLIDFVLRLIARLESSFFDEQRMISAFDQIKLIERFHLCSSVFEQVQRTEPVPGPLHKQNWCRQFVQHLRTQLCSVTPSAKRIAKTDYRGHIFFQCEMAAYASSHALSDENG